MATTNFDRIRRSCEETPFVVVYTPTGSLCLYWTRRAGVYGHQVHGFATDRHCREGHPKCRGAGDVFFVTEGCGYNKESAALDALFTRLGYQPRGMKLGAQSVPSDYAIGGNAYRIPARDWLRVPKGLRR